MNNSKKFNPADMRPSEVAEYVQALDRALDCITKAEQKVIRLQKMVNELRLHNGWATIDFNGQGKQ